MIVNVKPLNVACWNYHIPLENPSPMALYLGTYHIHLAIVDIEQVFSTVTISSGFSGLWELLNSSPALTEKSAISKYNEIKRMIRAEVKENARSGILVPSNGCSPIKVERTFIHIHENQGVELYVSPRENQGGQS